MPHLCIKGLDKPFVLFARLNRVIDFDSTDGAPVDLVCLLLSPAEDGPHHLRRLSRLSRLLRNTQFCRRLRDVPEADGVRALMHGLQPQEIAIAA